MSTIRKSHVQGLVGTFNDCFTAECASEEFWKSVKIWCYDRNLGVAYFFDSHRSSQARNVNYFPSCFHKNKMPVHISYFATGPLSSVTYEFQDNISQQGKATKYYK